MNFICSTCGDELRVIQHYDVSPIRYYCGKCSGCDRLEIDERCDKCYEDIEDPKIFGSGERE